MSQETLKKLSDDIQVNLLLVSSELRRVKKRVFRFTQNQFLAFLEKRYIMDPRPPATRSSISQAEIDFVRVFRFNFSESIFHLIGKVLYCAYESSASPAIYFLQISSFLGKVLNYRYQVPTDKEGSKRSQGEGGGGGGGECFDG